MKFRLWLETNLSELVNNMEWQHGSDAFFHSFDDNKIGSRTDPGFFGAGHYLVEKKTGIANRWGKKVYDVLVNVANPLLVSGITEFVKQSRQPSVNDLRQANPNLSEKDAFKIAVTTATNNLKEMGYDSVLIKKSDGTYQLVVFNSKNIRRIS